MEEKFINFLKKSELYNEEFLNYLNDRTLITNHFEENKDIIGTYPILDEKNILKDIKICIPKLYNDIEVGVYINEYVTALMLYRNLNKEYKKHELDRIIPTYYELIYLKENNQEDYLNLYLEELKEQDDTYEILLNIFNKDELNVDNYIHMK